MLHYASREIGISKPELELSFFGRSNNGGIIGQKGRDRSSSKNPGFSGRRTENPGAVFQLTLKSPVNKVDIRSPYEGVSRISMENFVHESISRKVLQRQREGFPL
jgi:hypothetical protein